MASPTSTSFRHLMGCFPTGIIVATTHDAKLGRVGITINSLTSVSLEPSLVLFCLDKKAHLHATFRRSTHFAINFLAEDQKNISQHFANYHAFPEPKGMWDKPQHECPLIRGTLGWAVCRTSKIIKGGDHSIILGEVIGLHQRKDSKPPLLYFQGKYRTLAE